MDWKLLLGGVGLTLVGGLIVFRFRKSNFNRELGAGCVMTIGTLMLMTGVLAAAISFLMRA